METKIKSALGHDIVFTGVNAIPIVKSDTKNFDPGILFVGTGGDVKVKMRSGSDFVTFKNIPDGTFLPILIIGVHTDTTAADMLIVY